ncbi:MAG: LPS-assembly protein LptD, partial [Alphaproteobacteria bacterium]|nr:LPS-assembly protein LptD [Alphaproteobacteria bacterium]
TKESVLIAGEYRQRFNNGTLRARIGFTREDGSDGGPRIRSHLDTAFNFDINDYWRWGGHIQVASDDTFLQRYGISGLDTLTNRLFAEGFSQRNYAFVEAIVFQGLNEEDDQERIPIIAPNIDVNLVGQPQFIGDVFAGRYSANLNIRALTREEGVDSQRLSGEIAWQLPVAGLIGDRFTLNGSVRGDLYRVENSVLVKQVPPRAFDGYRGRIYPELKLDWNWPLVRQFGDHIQQYIEPVAQLVVAPNGSNPDGVPNEDSVLFEFDETSLFSGNRFPGLDRVEGGKHFSYGFNFGVFGLNGGSASAFIGQSLQFRENKTFLVGTGIEDTFSDYIVRLEVTPTRLMNVLYKGRLDKENFEPRRQELQGNIGVPALNLSGNYLFFEAFGEFPTREEVRLQVTSHFAPQWEVAADWRRDLTRTRGTISYGGSLRYICDCLDLKFIYKRTFTEDRDVDPEDTFLLNVTLKHLGQLQSQVF